MCRNYLKIAFRNLLKQKVFSAINIFGLSLGIACCTLVILFVENELNYDRHHQNIESIFLVRSHYKEMDFDSTPDPLGPSLVKAFPEAVATCRLWSTETIVQSDDDLFKEKIHFADKSFFQVFTFPLEHGNQVEALADLKSVVLSQRMANKYFADRDPVGQTLSINLADEFHDFVITGIANVIPNNSSIQFDFLLPFESNYLARGEELRTKWMSFGVTTFLQLTGPDKNVALTDKLEGFIENYMGEAIQADEEKAEHFSFGFQPFADYHLSLEGSGTGLESSTDATYVYVLSGIAALVLLIACFNFTNLSIGQASGRFREIGIRKVVGAQRRQLIRQFWFEALLLSFLSLLLGVTMAELFLPTFNGLTGSELSIDFVQQGWLLATLCGLTALVGMGAGSYPALVLSSFRATEIFRGKLRIGGKNLLTQSLVVAQFCLSIFLIVSTIIMNRQQNFMRNANLGFDKDQIVVIPTQVGRGNREEGDLILNRFKNQLQTDKQILSVTGTSGSFGRGNSAEFKTKDDGSRVITYLYRVDLDYLTTLDIQLSDGRDFSSQFSADLTESVIVNEAFLRDFEIEEPIGYTMPRAFAHIENARIVGVVKDYHFQKLHSKIYPMMLYMAETASINHVLVKIRPDALVESVAKLERFWKSIRPDRPFEYSFLDEDVDKQYRIEMNWSRAVGYASLFAVAIACLGLLGLTMLTVARRTKEIGIRKVLGAPVAGIIQLLSGEFTKLVLVANVIAWPVAYLILKEWLQRFAYRIDIGFSYFILAAGLSLFVALFTISFQAVRAALSNPVDSLRYE